MLRRTLSRNRELVLPLARGVARGVVQRPGELRHHVVRDVWTVAKRFGAEGVVNIEQREVPCLRDVVVEGFLDDPQRLVLAGIAKGIGARTVFEIGTNRGRTAWTLARNLPDARVLTLDLPVETEPGTALALDADDVHFRSRDAFCGEAFRGTPEAERITQLLGDSATFDVSPWAGQADLVYVDGAHAHDYVLSDSAKALELLAPGGVIAWDDYTTGVGVFRAVNELAATLDRPVYHLFGTRMALFTRRDDLVVRVPPDDFASLPTV